MNDGSRYSAVQQEVWSTQLKMLMQSHLAVMQTSQAELFHSVEQLEATRPTSTRLYAWYGLYALANLHATAISAIVKEGQDFSAHTLALEALRLAVNVMYVLADANGDRLASTLRNHLDTEHARLQEWLAVAPGNEKASARAQFVAAYRKLQPWYADAASWPPLNVRANAIGMGDWVYPILARVTNAEDLSTKRLTDYLECERGSEAERQAAHVYRTARGDADAYYVETVALRLFATALQKTAEAFGDRVAVTVADSAIEQLDGLVADHNKFTAARENDNHIYMRFPSGAT